MDVNPFLDESPRWRRKGWKGVIPMPLRQKWPPLKGFTGADGVWPTDEQEAAWLTGPPQNFAVRVPEGIIGIDADTYLAIGAETYAKLVERCGPLPPTYVSSARGGFEHGGIGLFKVPVGLKFRNLPGLEIIQTHHRYVARGIHPDGMPYVLYGPWGEPCRADEFPEIDDIPDLPWTWIEALVEGAVPGHTTTPTEIDPRTEVMADLLIADYGAEIHHIDGGVIVLTRSGKAARDGYSATVGYIGPGVMRCFSARWAPFQIDHVYDITQLRYHAEHGRWPTGGELLANLIAPAPALTIVEALPAVLPAVLPHPKWVTLDLRDLLTRETTPEDRWLLEPIIPKGRQIALYAKHKTGKSLVALWLTLQLAKLGLVVVYMDHEMNEDDLADRLGDMGLDGDEAWLDNIKYLLHPLTDPFDTAEGALQLDEIITAFGAVVVIIDTMSRTISGSENDADTVIQWSRNAGLVVRSRQITLIRVDHAGKDDGKGMRGSSAKGDDVDLVWHVQRDGPNLALLRMATRMGWVPERVDLILTPDEDRALWFEAKVPNDGVGGLAGLPTGLTHLAIDAVRHLDEIAYPADGSANGAFRALRQAGFRHRRAAVLDAMRHLRSRAANGTKALVTGLGTTDPSDEAGTAVPDNAKDQVT